MTYFILDLITAYESGITAGLDPANDIDQNPYPETENDLYASWREGFMKGDSTRIRDYGP